MVSVIGSGGHSRVVIAALLASGVPVENVFDEDETRAGARVAGRLVQSTARLRPGTACVVALGDNWERQRTVERFPAVRWATVVHPSAIVSDDVVIGPGSVLMAGAVIQPHVRIGSHVIVNTRSSVDHDCILDSFASVAPGATLCGSVRVGARSAVGTGATVREKTSIAAGCTLGMGAALTRSMPTPNQVWAGVPARFLKMRGDLLD